MTIYFALALLAALFAKHMVADFFAQPTVWQKTKHLYVSPGNIKHSGLHAVLTLAVLAGFGYSWLTCLLLSLLDYVVHFHIDWAKAKITQSNALAQNNPLYWNIFGIDQFLHQLTYIGLVLILIKYA